MKKVEKVNTCFLPTPLHKMDNLTKLVSKGNLYIKRDDMTGIGMGGNKLRKLDYILKYAMDLGYTTVLTYGGIQTNHGRLTAAAAARMGLKSIIMCYGVPPKRMSGNLVLDRIIGAEVVFMDSTKLKEDTAGKSYDEIVAGYMELKARATDGVIKKYTDLGEKVYIMPIGGHTHEGLLGYFDCIKEIIDQSKEMGIKFDYVVVGNGSGGTLAGMMLGAKYFNAEFKILATNISKKQDVEMQHMIDFANEASAKFEMGVTLDMSDLFYTEDYTGIGYNIPDKKTRDTVCLLASTEGILLDPCYTGKSFAGYLGMIKDGTITEGSNSLFIHTGGTPGIWTEEHEDGFNEDLWGTSTVY